MPAQRVVTVVVVTPPLFGGSVMLTLIGRRAAQVNTGGDPDRPPVTATAMIGGRPFTNDAHHPKVGR